MLSRRKTGKYTSFRFVFGHSRQLKEDRCCKLTCCRLAQPQRSLRDISRRSHVSVGFVFLFSTVHTSQTGALYISWSKTLERNNSEEKKSWNLRWNIIPWSMILQKWSPMSFLNERCYNAILVLGNLQELKTVSLKLKLRLTIKKKLLLHEKVTQK